MDLVSVMIPAYNYARFIATAVDSVLAQTYPNVEVVVCDNCSTDGTLALLEERYGRDPRVRVFRNERNIGMIPNFNRILTHARGAFVAWLSADDWLLPRHLARMHALFASAPQIDVVYSRTYATDAAGNVYGMKGDPSLFPADYVDVRDELPAMLFAINQVCLPGALFRRALFDELGPLDETVPTAADWELGIRIALAGKRFAYLSEPSACLRGHGENASEVRFYNSGAVLDELMPMIERVLDHPDHGRIRGYESRIVNFVDYLTFAVRIPERTEARDARWTALRARLLQHDVYEPARVREHRVSVAIPMTMRPVALVAALDSLAAQTFSNWEACIVEQGVIPVSELVRGHPAHDRIRCVRLARELPAGAARNVACAMIRGEYLAFLDEDNTLAPNHFETLVETIATTGADVAVAGARLVVDRREGWGTYVSQRTVEGLFRGAGDPAALGAVANALPLNAVLHHRRFYERGGHFNDEVQVLEDFDYLTRLQSTARFAFSGVTTLDVHVRVQLEMQALGAYANLYLGTLDALYSAREVAPELVELRAAHRRAVAGALERLADLTASADGITSLVRTLAGRSVFPVRNAQPSIS